MRDKGLNATASPEDTLTQLYSALSCEAGGAISSSRVKACFLPDARILVPGIASEDRYKVSTLTVGAFLERIISPQPEVQGREEIELWHKADLFGAIAHVWSAYELRFGLPSGEIAVRRGINSVQMHYDGGRWQIASLIWDIEREDNFVPKAYGEHREDL